MKDPFKVFKDIKSKEQKEIEVATPPGHTLEVEVKKGYEHFQPKVFEKIIQFPEYDFLKNGIYVSEELLKGEDWVQEIKNDFSACMDMELRPDRTINCIDNFDAKIIQNYSDSLMLTLPEWMCIHEYEKYFQTSEITMFKEDPWYEWVDAIIHKDTEREDETGALIQRKYWMYKHLAKDGWEIEEEPEKGFEIPEYTTNNGFFNFDDIEIRSGLPKNNTYEGEYLYRRFAGNNGAKFGINVGPRAPYMADLVIPEIRIQRTYGIEHHIGIRICKKVEESDIIKRIE